MTKKMESEAPAVGLAAPARLPAAARTGSTPARDGPLRRSAADHGRGKVTPGMPGSTQPLRSVEGESPQTRAKTLHSFVVYSHAPTATCSAAARAPRCGAPRRRPPAAAARRAPQRD